MLSRMTRVEFPLSRMPHVLNSFVLS